MGLISDILSGVEKILKDGLRGALNDVAEASQKQVGDDVVAGDVNINGIFLLNADGSKQDDLLQYVTSIDIYEHIFLPTITARIALRDEQGFEQNFPLIGEEYVRINFTTPKSDVEASYLLRVDDVLDKKINTNNKISSCILKCVSVEFLRGASRSIGSQTFEDTHSGITQRIFDEYIKTNKPVTIETSINVDKYTLSRTSPFKAIQRLAGRAMSVEYESNSWVFFENRRGFNFTVIEKLIEDGAASANDPTRSTKQFIMDMNRNASFDDVKFRNIIAHKQIQKNNGGVTEKSYYGAYNNVRYAFDMITGNLQGNVYKETEGASKFKQLDGQGGRLNTSSFINQTISDDNENIMSATLMAVGSDIPYTLEQAARNSKRDAYIEKIFSNKSHIHIYGDTDITVGDVINCSFPSATTGSEDPSVSRLDSGNYLITALRHMITVGDRPQHTIALEIVKGNLAEEA